MNRRKNMRRNNKDIEADILRITIGGARKTQIVYQGNLNFKIVKGYLSRLIAKPREFLRYDGRRFYHTTPRGIEFLRRYDLLQCMDEQPPMLAV